jgi:SAM-dependent methyltransferase
MNLRVNVRESLFRILYWLVNKLDKNGDILFMNFGFSEKGQVLQINEDNESERYSIQLYHHLAIEAEIRNKNIVEIGCGRGGGLAYITRNFSPASAIGVDLEKTAIEFCNSNYMLEGLSFLQGNGQSLNLENNSCDVVINVESSHRYTEIISFLEEVLRILRPNGYFLFTDFRYDYEMEGLKRILALSGMAVIKERFINKEVIAALKLDDERRRNLVKKLVPKFLHKKALNFAGVIGSDTFKNFVSGKYVYFSYVLRKN